MKKEIGEMQKTVANPLRSDGEESMRKKWRGTPNSRERLPVLSGYMADCTAYRAARCCLFQLTLAEVDCCSAAKKENEAKQEVSHSF